VDKEVTKTKETKREEEMEEAKFKEKKLEKIPAEVKEKLEKIVAEIKKLEKELSDSKSKLVKEIKDLEDLESERDTCEEKLHILDMELKKQKEQEEDDDRNYEKIEKTYDKEKKVLNKEEKTLKQAVKKIREHGKNREKILNSYLPLFPTSSISILESFVNKWWKEEEKWNWVEVESDRKGSKPSKSAKVELSLSIVAEYPVKVFDFDNTRLYIQFDDSCDSTKIYDYSDSCAYRMDCMMRMCGDEKCDRSCGEDEETCEGDCASS